MGKTSHKLISALLLAYFLSQMWPNNVVAVRPVQGQWTLKEVRFTTDSASIGSPGKLKVVVTEGKKVPTNGAVTLVVSFQAMQGAPVSIKIDPDEALIAGRNKDISEDRNIEVTFSVPKDQGKGSAIVKAVATLHNPVNSTINGATDEASSNQLIVNKGSL